MISANLLDEYRRALTVVVEETGSLISPGLRQLEIAGVSKEALRDAASRLSYDVAMRMGDTAAAVAADFYEAVRFAELGEFRDAYLPFGPTRGEVDQSVRHSARLLFDREGADGRMYAADPDAFAREVRSTTERFALNFARDTIVESGFYDPRTPRWSRVARPDSCDYCRGQMEMGWTWPSRDSADSTFFHTHCRCLTVPSWDSVPAIEGVPNQKVERGDRDGDVAGTQRQLSALYARLSDSSVTDRLGWASDQLGRSVSSFTDLSAAEVSRLLTQLGMSI